MINARKTQLLPQNLDQFVKEIGSALRAMYGRAAEEAYTALAIRSYARLVGHPDVQVWTTNKTDSPGLLMGILRRGVVHITLLHVLESESGKGIEEALLNAAAKDLRDQGVRAIIGEFVRNRPLNVEPAMKRLGFTRFDRQMMIASLKESYWKLEACRVTVPGGPSDTPAAGILFDAYQDHPSRSMHPETHHEDDALAFLKAYRGGAFGQTVPEFYRVYPRNQGCEGMILGAEAAPGVGFILHVATARASQRRGIGTTLIRETANEFRRANYDRMVLGVTCGNPAKRLYEGLGFEPFLPVETYVWWANAVD